MPEWLAACKVDEIADGAGVLLHAGGILLDAGGMRLADERQSHSRSWVRSALFSRLVS